MALFLARSALCIGAVAWAASGAGVGPLADVLHRGARGAADDAGRTCLASTACLRAGAAAIGGATPLLAAMPEPAPAVLPSVGAPKAHTPPVHRR